MSVDVMVKNVLYEVDVWMLQLWCKSPRELADKNRELTDLKNAKDKQLADKNREVTDKDRELTQLRTMLELTLLGVSASATADSVVVEEEVEVELEFQDDGEAEPRTSFI